MLRKLVLSCFVVLLLGLPHGTDRAAAAEGEVVLLDGRVWQELSPDSKLAFIWGIVHVIEFERQLAKETWKPGDPSFVPHFVAGLKGKSMNDVVIAVDNYYLVSSDRLDHPVMQAIVETIVLPAL